MRTTDNLASISTSDREKFFAHLDAKREKLLRQIRFRSRFPRWFNILFHPVDYYRYKKARRECGLAAQQVLDSVIDGFTKALKFFESLAEFTEPHPQILQSSARYAEAGCPFGKSVRGKKKWLREQRRV